VEKFALALFSCLTCVREGKRKEKSRLGEARGGGEDSCGDAPCPEATKIKKVERRGKEGGKSSHYVILTAAINQTWLRKYFLYLYYSHMPRK